MLNNRKPIKRGQQHETSPALKRVRKNVYTQALLTGFLIVLTVVILFAVTAAWYTNIVQTNDLVFKSTAWGFEGQVKSVDAAIIASPGDEGVVELTARSESDDITAVSLNISKAQMPEEIQKRIYFYVDTSKTSNSEAMDRVYLGNHNSYTYMLFSRETLTLTEAVHTDALVKWQWVYDVLGYYVVGTWDGTSMDVSEYLRPIEYNYDEARTTFDVYGDLVSIDGTTSVVQFLEELSAHDGYAGTIDVLDRNGGGYYPVSVDSSGYGVWAYLCNYSEIQVNTAYDTYLGEDANRIDAEGEQAAYVAKLTLSAQNSYLEPTQIDTPSALLSAIHSGETAVIQLNSDMDLNETLSVGSALEAQQVMLDLNGNTLTLGSNDLAAIQVAPGSSLTVTDGVLVGDGESYAIDGTGAEITLSGVTVTGFRRAIYARDNESGNTLNADAKIHLADCTIETTDVSVFMSGNGGDSVQTTQLIVEDSVIHSSEYGGIVCNGSPDQYGTEIQVINSEISGKWCGIYHPQDKSTLVISDGSVITGYTGLVLKGGTTKVVDSTIHGTGAGIGNGVPEVSLSGFCDTGDAIYIESNYIGYHGYDISLSVSGSSFVMSDSNLALRIYPDNRAVGVSVSGGTFSSPIADEYLVGNTSCVEMNGSYVVSAIAVAQEEQTVD